MKGIYLTESEAVSLRDYIDINLVQGIAEDFKDGEDTSLLWLYNMLNIYKKCGGLEQFADYVPESNTDNGAVKECKTCRFYRACYDCPPNLKCSDCNVPCATCQDEVYNNWESINEAYNDLRNCNTCISNGICYHCVDDCDICSASCATCDKDTFSNWVKANEYQ